LSVTDPQVVPNLSEFISSVKHTKKRFFRHKNQTVDGTIDFHSNIINEDKIFIFTFWSELSL